MMGAKRILTINTTGTTGTSSTCNTSKSTTILKSKASSVQVVSILVSSQRSIVHSTQRQTQQQLQQRNILMLINNSINNINKSHGIAATSSVRTIQYQYIQRNNISNTGCCYNSSTGSQGDKINTSNGSTSTSMINNNSISTYTTGSSKDNCTSTNATSTVSILERRRIIRQKWKEQQTNDTNNNNISGIIVFLFATIGGVVAAVTMAYD